MTAQGRQRAASALVSATVSRALGEVSEADYRLAVDADVAAEMSIKAISKASEEARLVAAEQALAARIAPLDAELADLQAELAAAVKEGKLVALERKLYAEVVDYSKLASATMASLAQAGRNKVSTGKPAATAAFSTSALLSQ